MKIIVGLIKDRVHQKLQQAPSQYRYILVDEFQDTNDVQFELLKQLGSAGNLFVIGDPLQSIYGFRGASAAVFDRFIQQWPDTQQIRLTTNYRSVPQIVHVAAAIFPNVPALLPHRTDTGKVNVVEMLNEYGEADWVVTELERQIGGSTMLRSSKHHHDDRQRTFKNFAVIYRTHAAAKTVQRSLEASGIPYQVAGEGSPYEQPHIRAVLDVLAYIAGESAAPAVLGLTNTQVETLFSVLQADHNLPLTQLVQQIATRLGIDDQKHAVSLRQLINGTVSYDDRPVADYLAHIRHIAEQEYYDPAADAVTLLTIHAAKGLEFPCVFLIAAEEGILPHLPKGRPVNLDEERRLFFVAVTRARDELYMLHARKRATEPRQLSRFAVDLPGVEYTVDPALAQQQRKAVKRQQKRSQGKLF